MGTSLQITGGPFTKGPGVSLTLPDRTSLVGEFIMGKDATRTQKNVANQAAPATLSGATPVYSAYSTEFSGNAGFKPLVQMDTGISILSQMTIMAVWKWPNQGTSCVPASGGPGNLTGLYGSKTQAQFYNGNAGSAMPNIPTVSLPGSFVSGQFIFTAGVHNVGQTSDVYAITTGGGTLKATGALNGLLQTGNLKVANLGDVFDLAYLAIFSRTMTQAQVEACYASLKSYYTSKISIL